MILKNTLRKEIEYKLSKLANITELSREVSNNIFQLNEWEESDSVFIFISFKNEIDTSYLINRAKKENKRIFSPVIKNREMEFYRIDNLTDKDFTTNKFGILEPSALTEKGIPGRNSIIIVPGLGFTKTGSRLGRGGGYYDKYLGINKDGVKVAICFDFQVIENIPEEKWDQKMDIVVTEGYIYKKGVNNGN